MNRIAAFVCLIASPILFRRTVNRIRTKVSEREDRFIAATHAAAEPIPMEAFRNDRTDVQSLV